MIKLQNNYTTPEQSKMLLELGVPEDSADMYYMCMKHEDYEVPKVLFEPYSENAKFHPRTYTYLPCWSLGRLMEIYLKCRLEEYEEDYFGGVYTIKPNISFYESDRETMLDFVLRHFDKSYNFDFYKLEDKKNEQVK